MCYTDKVGIDTIWREDLWKGTDIDDMAKLWDDTMKRLVSTHPQHFVSWLLKGAHFKQLLPQELKNKTREADVIFQVLLNEAEMLLHLEFQSSDDTTMALRLLEYNV